uniref:Uncharacterized protein n=1 Tax=Geospiza parvula TaxID=87175 RepID=A0A8C3MTL6_GEOPR
QPRFASPRAVVALSPPPPVPLPRFAAAARPSLRAPQDGGVRDAVHVPRELARLQGAHRRAVLGRPAARALGAAALHLRPHQPQPPVPQEVPPGKGPGLRRGRRVLRLREQRHRLLCEHGGAAGQHPGGSGRRPAVGELRRQRRRPPGQHLGVPHAGHPALQQTGHGGGQGGGPEGSGGAGRAPENQNVPGGGEGEPGRHQPGVRPALALQTNRYHGVLGAFLGVWGHFGRFGGDSGGFGGDLGQFWGHSQRVSLADISLVCALLWLYKQVLDPAFRGPFGNVTRWFLTCLNQPEFKAVLGEVQLCQRMAQFDAKKFAESQARKEKDKEPPKKGDKGDKEPPKKEKPPRKEEKRPQPEEELDECEQVLAAEPKAKDPFAHLPKSPFVLDEFKRKYSNEDTLSVALPHFWEHFDREGWSLWYCQYRYPEELSQTFMSCNLITGMFQRLDKLRKNAFASVVLFGKDHDSSISGVWVMRGQELAFTLCPDWQVDYELHIPKIPIKIPANIRFPCSFR